jgi:hypothetical protein
MLRGLLIAVIAAIGGCLNAAGQSSADFCSSHSGTLYCLTPNFYANPSPDPFTAVLSTLGSKLGMVPLASPASGIVYTIDPSLKIPVAAGTETFGPVLVERGETLGARKFFAAFTYQHFSFSSIDSVSLNSIPILFNVCDPNNGQCAPIQTSNHISPRINQYAFFGTYGVTSRLDVSMAIPIINTSIRVAAESCTQPYCQTPIFSNQQQITFTPTALESSASGVGDIVLRGKAQVFRGERIRLAAGLDLRFPTGDALNFLGTGAFGVKPFVALSRSGRFAPHLNLAYQWNSDSIIGGITPGVKEKIPDNFFYDVGADVAATKRLTFAGDILGGYVNQVLRLQPITVTPQPTITVPVPVAVASVGISRGSFPTLECSVGLKFRPFKQFLISGNGLISLNHNGLRHDPVPLVGVSYTF